jgi:hypothetical protein
MDQKAFIKVMSAGALTWEEKNPIGYVFYPSQSQEKEHGFTDNVGSKNSCDSTNVKLKAKSKK